MIFEKDPDFDKQRRSTIEWWAGSGFHYHLQVRHIFGDEEMCPTKIVEDEHGIVTAIYPDNRTIQVSNIWQILAHHRVVLEELRSVEVSAD